MSESENLHAGSDSFTPPTTQSLDDKSSHSSQPRHQCRDNSSASAKLGAEDESSVDLAACAESGAEDEGSEDLDRSAKSGAEEDGSNSA
eukprot:3687252-Ditylum_brightwellii.AAC.1